MIEPRNGSAATAQQRMTIEKAPPAIKAGGAKKIIPRYNTMKTMNCFRHVEIVGWPEQNWYEIVWNGEIKAYSNYDEAYQIWLALQPAIPTMKLSAEPNPKRYNRRTLKRLDE